MAQHNKIILDLSHNQLGIYTLRTNKKSGKNRATTRSAKGDITTYLFLGQQCGTNATKATENLPT